MTAHEPRLVVRAPRPEDELAFRTLWQRYLDFYEADVPDTVSAATWRRILDERSPIFARLAEREGDVVGFAVALSHENTWSVSPVCYLEDLFVSEHVRTQGIGRALIHSLLEVCRSAGWSRLYWHTRIDNARARRLYESFVSADDFVRYRIVL